MIVSLQTKFRGHAGHYEELTKLMRLLESVKMISVPFSIEVLKEDYS